MPVNAKGYSKSEQRKANKSPGHIKRIERFPAQIQMGREEGFFFFTQNHIHF
jgi:hypothetical protein